MRWFLRAAVALTLSAACVTLLTWAGWPRPRFVARMPKLKPSALVQSERSLELDSSKSPFEGPLVARSPWLGYAIRSGGSWDQEFWFVNVPDGSSSGPWPTRGVESHDWDHRGAAVVSRLAGLGRKHGEIGRIDPKTGEFTLIERSRHMDFLLSTNGETLLTFTAPLWATVDPNEPVDGDFVCFDLTSEPPRRTRIDLVIRDGRPRDIHFLHRLVPRPGSVALSPDGRALAVSEVWRDGQRLSPAGVTLYDTRTGRATGRITDYGPALPPSDPPAEDGAFGLVFSPDSKFLRLHRLRWAVHFKWIHSPIHQKDLDKAGTPRVIDLSTGSYVPPPHPAYTPDRQVLPLPPLARTDEGSLRTEAQGDPAGLYGSVPFRFRVLAGDGTPLCDWRTLTLEQRGGFPILPGAQFVTGTTSLVWVNTDPSPPPTRWDNLFRRLMRRPPPGHRTEVMWYDWAADDLRVVRRFHDVQTGYESIELAVPNGRIAITRRHSLEGTGTVEVWDAPPPRQPWPWSVPSGFGLGLSITALGFRVLASRGRRYTRPPT